MIDHVMVTAGQPHYGRLLDMDLAQARRGLDEHILLLLDVARDAATIRVNLIAPGFVAALAVHIMTNSALTGATYDIDIDGGQQFVAG